MSLRKLHRHRIFNFTIRENAMQKTISESFNRMLNARTLDKIDTDADYAHCFRPFQRRAFVGQALRLLRAGTATGTVALQFSRSVRFSSWIAFHRAEHF